MDSFVRPFPSMMAERKIAMTARKTFSECHSGHSRTSQFCVVSLNQSVSANRPQQIIGQGYVQARKHPIYPFAAEGGDANLYIPRRAR